MKTDQSKEVIVDNEVNILLSLVLYVRQNHSNNVYVMSYTNWNNNPTVTLSNGEKLFYNNMRWNNY